MNRRELLLGTAAAALAARCAPRGGEPAGPAPVRFPVASVPIRERTLVRVHERPVELTRTEEGVTARSLMCTHLGCEVFWEESERAYLCPCHDGRFDAEGRVVNGPPPRALQTFPATVEGTDVVIRV